jgi:CubicO group peptidase (beta-lactamase class C family)
MPAPAFDPAALDRAFALAARQVEDGTAPFAILGVATRAGTVRLEAVSSPDNPRIGTEAVCLIASITKPIVGTAVMQLVAEGRLALGAPLDAVLPELAGPGRDTVTAWHLLSHTSGLAELDVEELIERGEGSAEVLERALRLESIAAPGAAYRYVSITFDLLAEAVARLDGVPFEVALRRRVLGPLGMAATTFDPRPALAGRMAPVEVADAGGGARSPEHARPATMDGFIDLRLAGGGLWSSAHDLLRFGRAMLRGGELDGGRVLPSAQLELMTREVTVGGIGEAPDPLKANHYALGWGRPGPDTPGSRRAFGHGGATGTRLWIDPEHDLVFLYLTGVWGFPLAPVDRVMQAVYAALA